MEESCERCLAMLSTALEKEEKGRDFYKDAVDKCGTELGKELFRSLMIDEGVHIQRIKQIYESLHGGQPWSDDWKSIKGINEDLQKLARQRINDLGSQIKAETTDLDALEIGIKMEQGAINFYEEQLKKATHDLEKEFIKCMIAEERTHFAALEDLKLYFCDPVSWYIEKERPPIDGA